MHQTHGADFYASLRTQAALEKAEVAVVLIDADEPLSRAGRPRIIAAWSSSPAARWSLAFNKWDLLDEERRHYLEREIERDLAQVPWAPRVNISAAHRPAHGPAGARAGDRPGLAGTPASRPAGSTRSSARSWLRTRTRCAAASSRASCSPPRPRTRPPRFVLFASGFLEAGYRRFLERRLREEFGFEGTPIEMSVRVREKRKR